MFLGLIGAIVVIALAAVLGIALGGGGEGGDAEVTAGGCMAQTFPEQGREHVETLPEGLQVQLLPADERHATTRCRRSGTSTTSPSIRCCSSTTSSTAPSSSSTATRCRRAEIDQIVAWYSEDPNGIIVAPLPGLEDKIAVTAWTHLMTCPAFYRGGLRRVHGGLPLPGARALQPRRDAARARN